MDVLRRWTGRVQNWGQILLQLSVFFPDKVKSSLAWSYGFSESTKLFTDPAPKVLQFYITYNPATQSLETASKVLFELPFGIMVAVFLLISAAAHALISLPKKTNTIYNSDLEKGINKFRWFEYALSSSVMIVLISTLFGIYDIGSLILIFVVNASMNLFGLVMEQLNSQREKTNWGPFIWG